MSTDPPRYRIFTLTSLADGKVIKFAYPFVAKGSTQAAMLDLGCVRRGPFAVLPGNYVLSDGITPICFTLLEFDSTWQPNFPQEGAA